MNTKSNWKSKIIYWATIALSFPLIPIWFNTIKFGWCIYIWIGYLIIWPLSFYLITKKEKRKLKNLINGLIIIIVFPIIYGYIVSDGLYEKQSEKQKSIDEVENIFDSFCASNDTLYLALISGKTEKIKLEEIENAMIVEFLRGNKRIEIIKKDKEHNRIKCFYSKMNGDTIVEELNLIMKELNKTKSTNH
jgi:hypothetical protein